jgi:Bifunctional DNA primase/polymerase, N-terminal/AAA domain
MTTAIHHDVLMFARFYAERGWRVIPIAPGQKFPAGFGQWQNQATTDLAVIDAWWGTSYPAHGVGVATGAESGIFVVDIDKAAGRAVLAQWVEQHGPLPETVEAITGSGDGTHLVFRHPGERVRTRRGTPGDTRGIPVGIDVRGDGGQFVAAPTIHPSGGRYQWVQGRAPWEHEIADAPAWLLDIVCDRGEPPAPPAPPALAPSTGIRLSSSGVSLPAVTDDKTPAQFYNRTQRFEDVLRRYGWIEMHRTGNEVHWKRPGKTDEGHSAILHDDATPILVVFSTSAPAELMQRQFETGRGDGWRFDPFEFYAAMEHRGDKSTAARVVRETMMPQRPRTPMAATTPWSNPAVETQDSVEVDDLFIDWLAAFNSDDADEDVLAEGFAHAGRWTAITAAAKQGKSTLALALAVALATGREPFTDERVEPVDVVYVDREMTHRDVRDRLEAMGMEPAMLGRFHYTETITDLDTERGVAQLHQAVARFDARVVIIDGVNGAVTGAENEDGPWRTLFARCIVPLKQANVAIITVDNTGKDPTKGPRGHSTKVDKPDAVLNLTRTDSGIRATATHRRTARFPQEMVLTTSAHDDDGGPLDFRRHGAGWPEGTAKLAAQLDDLGVPVDASKRTARTALKRADVKAGDRPILAALKFRKVRLTQSLGVQPATTESAESGARISAPPLVPGAPHHTDRFGF